MRVIIHEDAASVARWAAGHIASRINETRRAGGMPFVLGLPTGSTPLGTYRELIAIYRDSKVSFSNVVTFNMDEYVGLPENHPQSYHFFMWENFFSHVDIKRENVNIPNGNVADLESECFLYEEKIRRAGGIDLFLGGVGADGHIAFNEPFSSLSSRTRIKTLTDETIKANSRFFDGDEASVPRQAVTVGVGTIMDAGEVVILATGAGKADAVYHAIEEGISHKWPVSALQIHRRAIIVCDRAATGKLSKETVAYFEGIEGVGSDAGRQP